jgi:hypothetical protein
MDTTITWSQPSVSLAWRFAGFYLARTVPMSLSAEYQYARLHRTFTHLVEDQLAIYVSSLPAPSANWVGYALLTPHPWRPTRCDLTTEDIHFQSAALADNDTDEFLYNDLGHLAQDGQWE